MRPRSAALLLAALFLAAGCRAPAPAPRPHERQYSFVFLTTAEPQPALTAEASRVAFEGHFANMGRMREAGDLHLAGPFGEPRTDPGWRGIFVLDGGVERGAQLAATDPAVLAGIFEPVVLPFVSATDFEHLAALERARRAARAADPATDPADPDVGPYVLALARPWDVARAAVLGDALDDCVLVAGVLGGPDDPRLALLLDLESVDEAAREVELLAQAQGTQLEWELSSLWSARSLAELERGLRGH